MKRNDEDQMVLTEREFQCTALRDLLIKQGNDNVVAAEEALKSYKGKPSKKFVEWLSQERLTKVDGEVVPVAEVVSTEPEPAASGS